MERDVTAHLATFPARLDLLRSNIHRLRTIFSTVFICLNEFHDVPSFLNGDEGVRPFIPERDHKDTGKFISLSIAGNIAFLVDDDIVYPHNYVTRMLAYAEMVSKPAVLGVHGIIYQDRYAGGAAGRKVHHFESGLARFRQVDALGTGTVMINRMHIPPVQYMMGSAGFVDVRFAKFCAETGIPRICVPRPSRWLKSNNTEAPTLFGEFTSRNNPIVLKDVHSIRHLRTSPYKVSLKADINLLSRITFYLSRVSERPRKLGQLLKAFLNGVRLLIP